jgi:hypothetical protein
MGVVMSYDDLRVPVADETMLVLSGILQGGIASLVYKLMSKW